MITTAEEFGNMVADARKTLGRTQRELERAISSGAASLLIFTRQADGTVWEGLCRGHGCQSLAAKARLAKASDYFTQPVSTLHIKIAPPFRWRAIPKIGSLR